MRYLLTVLLVIISIPALAQQRVLLELSSGTGFFINKQGHIITNAHVVNACKSIVIHTAEGDLPAQLTVTDATRDLAVLRTAGEPRDIAPLRWNIDDLSLGDEVVLLGYPGQQGAAGRATFVKSRVSGLIGPTGETGVIQLESVAKQGNSGGPVLDSNGHVIAVISGKAQTFQTDPKGAPIGSPIRQADIAITLASLREFLQKNMIPFYQAASSGDGYGDRILEANAARFIVPIRCIKGTRPAA